MHKLATYSVVSSRHSTNWLCGRTGLSNARAPTQQTPAFSDRNLSKLTGRKWLGQMPRMLKCLKCTREREREIEKKGFKGQTNLAPVQQVDKLSHLGTCYCDVHLRTESLWACYNGERRAITSHWDKHLWPEYHTGQEGRWNQVGHLTGYSARPLLTLRNCGPWFPRDTD